MASLKKGDSLSPSSSCAHHSAKRMQGGECGAVDGWSEGQNLEPPISGVTTGQCVLLSDFGVFHVFSHNHNIWFDQIFVRFVAPPDGNESLQRDAFMISGQGSTAFMTGITVQGSGAQQPADSIGEGVLVIATNSSGAHMHEALFQDMRVLNADNSFIKTAGHLSLNNTQFQNVAAPDQKALIFVQATGKLRLAKVQFGPDASGTQVFVEGNTPNVWSEDPTQKVRDSITGQEATAPRLAAIPTPSPFTSLSNKWLQTLIVVRSYLLPMSTLSACLINRPPDYLTFLSHLYHGEEHGLQPFVLSIVYCVGLEAG